MTTVPALDLEIGGLAARVDAGDAALLGPLAARWQVCAARAPRAPDLTIEIRHDAALEGRPLADDYPAISRRLDGARLIVERADLRGELDLDARPLRARFRVAGHDHSVESAMRVALSVALPRRGGLLVHASAVERHGRAHVFAGVSGAGKSTIAALLDGVPGFVRLADELVVIARGADGWTLHVPPLLGLAGLPRGATRPLAAVHLIAQAPGHRREPLATAAAMRELMRHVVVYAAEPDTSARVLELVGQLLAEVPTDRLAFAKDPSVSEVLP